MDRPNPLPTATRQPIRSANDPRSNRIDARGHRRIRAVALLACAVLPAQTHSGFVQPLPGIMSTGSVVHPAGGVSAPGVVRTTGSVVHPGGSTTQIAIPGARPFAAGQRGQYRNGTGVYAYPVGVPVYVGGYGYGYGYGYSPMYGYGYGYGYGY